MDRRPKMNEREATKFTFLSREGNQLAAEFRRQREEREAAEDEHYRQIMLAKFAEDDKIDQMNAQRRRMK